MQKSVIVFEMKKHISTGFASILQAHMCSSFVSPSVPGAIGIPANEEISVVLMHFEKEKAVSYFEF